MVEWIRWQSERQSQSVLRLLVPRIIRRYVSSVAVQENSLTYTCHGIKFSLNVSQSRVKVSRMKQLRGWNFFIACLIP
jgi:hypothetical protein